MPDRNESLDDQALRHFMALREPCADSREQLRRRHDLQRWLDQGPDYRQAWLRCEQQWQAIEPLSPLFQAPKPRYSKSWKVATAAMVMLTLGLAWLLMPDDSGAIVNTRHVQTAKGYPQRLDLEDGTTLMIDGASRLQVRYSSRKRSVALISGAAFFDVAHQPRRPFVVDTGQGQVRVLGTAFEVDAWPGGARVAVTRGRVAVQSAGLNQSVEIVPGTAASLARGKAPDVQSQSADGVAGWRTGQLSFEGAALAEAVRAMGRHYRGTIQLSPVVADLRLTMSVKLAAVEPALMALPEVLPVRVYRNHNTIFVEPR